MYMYAPVPPCSCTYGLRAPAFCVPFAPAFCVLYAPEAQRSLGYVRHAEGWYV